jgi:hypothetical protein
LATTNANFKVKNGLDAVGAVTSAGLSLLSTTSPIILNGQAGTSGQVLTSAGAGATPTWTTVSGGGSGVPAGGTTGQLLYKINATDYNTGWLSQSSLTIAQSQVTNLVTSLASKLDKNISDSSYYYSGPGADLFSVTIYEEPDVKKMSIDNSGRLFIDNGGAITIRNGASIILGSSYGTPGQVLTSQGVSTTPTWTSVIPATGGTITGTLTMSGAALNLSGASSPLQLAGAAGTSGQVLTSAGTGATPTWTTPGDGVAWTGFASGYNYYAQGGSQSNGTNSLNNMTLVPFALKVAATFTKIGIMVNTAGTGSTVRLGIYNSTNGIPSSRLLDAGTVATTTSSTLALITISQTLQPGLYWLAAVNQGATCSSQIKGTGHVPMVPFFGSPANGTARGLQVTGVSGALPNPVGTLGMAATPFEVFLQI